MSTSSARIDQEAFSVTRTVRIAAPRDLVFAVLTEPSQIAQWFGQSCDFADGVHAGATGTFGWDDHGQFPARIESYDPPAGFAFTWGTPGEELREDNSTIATFHLTEVDGATELTVVETGFSALGDQAAARAAMTDNAQGWTEELDELVAHVEALVQSKDASDEHAGPAPVSDRTPGASPAPW